MKATILGCGSSGGVPMAGGFWGHCDPKEPRNQRTRSSLLVESDTTTVLVDAGHDVRQHLNRKQVQKLDGLLLTHWHSDHVNGLDDFRPLVAAQNKFLDVYSNEETMTEVRRMWPYMFLGSTNTLYPPTLKPHLIRNSDRFRIGDIDIDSVEQDHGVCTSLGFRFGSFAYSVDLHTMSDESIQRLQGIDTWVVGAAGYHREKTTSHANLKQVLEWVSILQPRMTYIGVLTIYMDYKTLCDELPPHIRPAYDGLEIEFTP
jgi:phosphoribosyl 1,2-cyclic phosphate phosphodiesterase